MQSLPFPRSEEHSNSSKEHSDSEEHSDFEEHSDSEKPLQQGDIRIDVTDLGSNKVLTIVSYFVTGVCTLSDTEEKYSCALVNSITHGTFAATFDERCELSAAVIGFVKAAATGSKASTASIERLLM